jgi:predicted DNA-binding transcriptional regulator AlpA
MNQQTTPILIPMQMDEFLEQIKKVIHSEVSKLQQTTPQALEYAVPGMTYKPLYKMSEICAMFSVSRPTIYSWIKDEKLRPYKIKSRVYFLWEDVRKLIEGK